MTNRRTDRECGDPWLACSLASALIEFSQIESA
jgi:hypothetical protein